MNACTRRHASADSSANSAAFRSKKLCGAPGVRVQLVRDARIGERAIELLDRRRRDALVRATEEPEDRGAVP